MRKFALNMFIHACPVLLIQPSSVCDLCFSFYFYLYIFFYFRVGTFPSSWMRQQSWGKEYYFRKKRKKNWKSTKICMSIIWDCAITLKHSSSIHWLLLLILQAVRIWEGRARCIRILKMARKRQKGNRFVFLFV